MLVPGQKFDRYEVIEPIASGGMAEVFRVRHTALDTEHALKVLVLRTADIRRRLLQEGRMQASLRHPNAVAVTDVVDVDGHPGLVMEYVNGPTLLNWRYDEQPDFVTVEQVFRGIVAGVGAAHELDMVHRDLKPSNVLIAGTQGAWVPKVCDFGLAKALRSHETDDATRSGVPMGTPSYMAPEQIADAKSVDARADLFSLGALLYYLCTGQKAFDGRNAVETYNAVLDGEYTPASHHDPKIPFHLLSAIEACLRVDPHARCPNTDALLEILDGASVPPLVKSTPAPPTRPRASFSWRPMLAITVGFGAGVSVLLLVWYLRLPAVPDPASSEPVVALDQGTAILPKRHEEAVAEAPACTSKKGVYGYLNLSKRVRRGTFIKLTDSTVLHSVPGGPKNTCSLPPGTGITTRRSHKKNGRFWVAVHPTDLRLPE